MKNRLRKSCFAAVALLVVISGCPMPKIAPMAETHSNHKIQQQQWWAEHKGSASYEAGKGFLIDQVGYFDSQGQPLETEVPKYSWLKDGPKVNEEEADEGIDISSYSPLAVATKARNLVYTPKNETTARDQYRKAEELFRRKKYDSAKSEYKNAAASFPSSPLEEDALFMIAECDFLSEHYPVANEEYGELLKKYSTTQYLAKVSKRRFQIARTWVKLEQEDPQKWYLPNFGDKRRPKFDVQSHALAAFEEIAKSDPTGDLADISTMAAADTYFNKDNFGEADYHYSNLIKHFPHSKYLFQAYMRSLECKMQLYQGSDYGGSPLNEAQELIDQLLVQFPDQLKTEQAKKLTKLRNTVLQKVAQRDWSTAQYFANRGDAGGARYYYAGLIRKHPGTQLARAATAEIEKLRGRPDHTDHPLTIMTKWLPGGEEDNNADQRARVADRSPPGGAHRN